MPKAWSYIRFSSEKQELGDSLRRQVALAEKYALEHGLTLDTHSYRDLGVSAFKGKNAIEGQLQTLLNAIKQGVIEPGSLLLIESFDRLSRDDVLDALSLFTSIINAGVTIVTLQDRQVFSREEIGNNWTKLIIALAVMSRANEESATKSRRVKEAWEAKRKTGEILTAISPSWLRLSDDRRKWLLVPDKVKIVQSIFKMSLAGNGTPTIARSLNEDRVPTLGSAPDWTVGVLANLLRNSSVIGTYTPKRQALDPIPNYYPAIIEPKTFYAVQDAITSRRATGGRKGAGVVNLFSGAMRCGYCGARVRYIASDKINTYVRCATAYANKLKCQAKAVPYRPLEKGLLELVMIYDKRVEATAGVDNTGPIRAELALKRKQADNVINAILDAPDSRGLTERLKKVEAEIGELEQQLRSYVAPRPDVQVWAETQRQVSALVNREGADLAERRLEAQGQLRVLFKEVRLLNETHYSKGADRTLQLVDITGPMAELMRSDYEDKVVPDDEKWSIPIGSDAWRTFFWLPPIGIDRSTRR